MTLKSRLRTAALHTAPAILAGVVAFTTGGAVPALGAESPTGLQDEIGYGLGAPTGDSYEVVLPGGGEVELVESWNGDGFPGFLPYQASCFGFAYVPAESFLLTRIEFFAGYVPGPVAVELRSDDGSGHPTGPVLTRIEYEQVEELGWQGADFDPPVLVDPSQTYYIRYEVVPFSLASVAVEGEIIAHDWAQDCVFWEGPVEAVAWMARFYGDRMPTSVRPETWSNIKALYR